MEQLWAPWRIEYVQKAKESGCILCQKPRENNDEANFILYRGQHNFIILNTFPYNPGHLLIFPKRHITDIRLLTDEEILELNSLTKLSMNVLDVLYSPGGYNIGYNIGQCSGASLEHLHLHIVPRYSSEIGFVDIVAGSKIIVEDPNVTLIRAQEEFKKQVKN